MRGKSKTLVLLLAAATLLSGGCAKRYIVLTPLQQPLVQPSTCVIGTIEDGLPWDMDEADRPTREDINKLKNYLWDELEKKELLDLHDTGPSAYQVRGTVVSFKKGSGFLRFMFGMGIGSAHLKVNLELVDTKFKDVVFSGNFTSQVSDGLESGAENFRRVAKDFAKALQKELKRLEKEGVKSIPAESAEDTASAALQMPEASNAIQKHPGWRSRLHGFVDYAMPSGAPYTGLGWGFGLGADFAWPVSPHLALRLMVHRSGFGTEDVSLHGAALGYPDAEWVRCSGGSALRLQAGVEYFWRWEPPGSDQGMTVIYVGGGVLRNEREFHVRLPSASSAGRQTLELSGSQWTPAACFGIGFLFPAVGALRVQVGWQGDVMFLREGWGTPGAAGGRQLAFIASPRLGLVLVS